MTNIIKSFYDQISEFDGISIHNRGEDGYFDGIAMS